SDMGRLAGAEAPILNLQGRSPWAQARSAEVEGTRNGDLRLRYATLRTHGGSAMAARKQQAFRIEHDSMGELQVPAAALWGAQTQRAIDDVHISGRPMPAAFVRALALVKASAA